MKTLHTIVLALAVSGLAGCVGPVHPVVGADKGYDLGINSHPLETLVAGIWIDPDGCDHWIIDDGVEGYLSPRLTPDGIPVCSGLGVEDNAYAPFKDGTFIPDPL